MMRRVWLPGTMLALLAVSVATAQPPESTPSQPPEAAVAASAFPATSMVYAELTHPRELLSLVLDHPIRERIESLPQYQAVLAGPRYKQFLLARTMVEGQLQMSWREAIESLVAKRVAVAFDPATEGVAVLLHGKDAASMEHFKDTLLKFRQQGGKADRIQQSQYRDVSAFRIGPWQFALWEDRLLLTNRSNLGKAMIDRVLDGGPSLADNPRFQQALTQRPGEAQAWVFVDVQALRQLPRAREAFENQINNPVVEAAVGGIQSVLAETPLATMALMADAQSLQLQMATPFDATWIPEKRDYFFGPQARGRGPALPVTDQTLVTLSAYRDLSEMWLRAGDLFNARINDEFAKADANLSTLFAGRDFGEDILGSFEPEIGFVAVRQDFMDVLPQPAIRLPAFAAVMQMKEPAVMTRELRRIFQSLVGFLNVVGAMNGQNQLELGGVQFDDGKELVTSTFVPEPDQQQSTEAEIAFNFSPSIGFAGDRFVVASSRDLARQLIEKTNDESKPLAHNTAVVAHANVLKQILDDNRGQLVAQNMLEEGNSVEEAEAAIDLLLQVVGYFQDVSFQMGSSDNRLEANLKVRLQP